MTNSKLERDCGYLFTIKQKSDESLKDFVQRFNRAMLEVPAVDTKVAATAVVQGVLVNNPFHLSITKLKFISMEQFIAKVEKHILQEENLAARKSNGSDNLQEKSESSHHGAKRSNFYRDWSNRDWNDRDRFDDDKENRGFRKKKSKYHYYPMYKDFTTLTKHV